MGAGADRRGLVLVTTRGQEDRQFEVTSLCGGRGHAAKAHGRSRQREGQSLSEQAHFPFFLLAVALNFSEISALERAPLPEVKRISAVVLKKPFFSRLLSAMEVSSRVTVSAPEAGCLTGVRPLPKTESSPRSGTVIRTWTFEAVTVLDLGAATVPGASNFAVPGLESCG